MQFRMLLWMALVFAALTTRAGAQDFGGAFSGFNSGSNAPIQIEADRLEVRDEEKLAIYSGHVRVLQEGTLLEAPELRIFYKNKQPAAPDSAASTGGSVSGSQVDRIEAGPGVRVTSEDQVATSDRAIFDMAKDLVTMSGNVLLTQGDNVVHGERLIVNLTTKEARIEGGRVQTLITPSGGAAKKP
jgi:lipopolysaccharide export system protein LptA